MTRHSFKVSYVSLWDEYQMSTMWRNSNIINMIIRIESRYIVSLNCKNEVNTQKWSYVAIDSTFYQESMKYRIFTIFAYNDSKMKLIDMKEYIFFSVLPLRFRWREIEAKIDELVIVIIVMRKVLHVFSNLCSWITDFCYDMCSQRCAQSRLIYFLFIFWNTISHWFI